MIMTGWAVDTIHVGVYERGSVQRSYPYTEVVAKRILLCHKTNASLASRLTFIAINSVIEFKRQHQAIRHKHSNIYLSLSHCPHEQKYVQSSLNRWHRRNCTDPTVIPHTRTTQTTLPPPPPPSQHTHHLHPCHPKNIKHANSEIHTLLGLTLKHVHAYKIVCLTYVTYKCTYSWRTWLHVCLRQPASCCTYDGIDFNR